MSNDESTPWKGVHISELQCSLNIPQFPEVVNKDDHTVLVQTPIIPGKVPDCFPSIYDKVDHWDGNHVKLPCSEKNVTEDQINRWSLIREALSSVILSGQQLEAAILSYNKRFAEKWNFSTLRLFFENVCDEEESAAFFQSLLPKMIDLALCLPELVTGGIPMLKHGRTHSVTLSQMQIASLLANAFFVTFPHRNSYAKGCEYANYPTINFTRLFQGVFRDRKKATVEKIKCILHYFRRVTATPPTGVVTYSRRFVPKLLIPDWAKSTKMLPKLYVSSTGTIEDEGFGLLQVDFAHKLVGGGVIANGCVQEEIRFIICPELILSRLFTECLEDNEALIVTGCERFSKYKGYGKSFEWDGNYADGTPSDQEGRKYCTVVAIDALFFKKNFAKEQFLPSKMDRELNKAYAGFSWSNRRKKEELAGIATGNWGCGVYRGNPEFKSILQLMAAAESNRDLAYFTFGDDELRDSMHAIHQVLISNKITIGKIYDILLQYNAGEHYDSISVYDYIKKEVTSSTGSKKENENPKPLKPFGVFAVTKRSLCYSSKNERNKNDNTSTPSKPGTSNSTDEPPSCVSNETEDLEMKNRKCQEVETLRKFYQSAPTPSTSAANFSDHSDDSLDLDNYRSFKRTKCTFDELDSQRSEYEQKNQTMSESEEELDQNLAPQNEENDNEEMINEPVPEDIPEPCPEEPKNENFELIRKSPEREKKSPLRSRSVPLKGLTFVRKKSKDKSNSSKKKFLEQKTKISHFFSPS